MIRPEKGYIMKRPVWKKRIQSFHFWFRTIERDWNWVSVIKIKICEFWNEIKPLVKRAWCKNGFFRPPSGSSSDFVYWLLILERFFSQIFRPPKNFGGELGEVEVKTYEPRYLLNKERYRSPVWTKNRLKLHTLRF